MSFGIRCAILFVSTAVFVICGCYSGDAKKLSQHVVVPDDMHVYEGDDIQAALNSAADSGCMKVVLHEGTYRPGRHGQALIYLNQRHEGLHLVADGEVVLRGDNESLADPSHAAFPAMVNHVVYIGDGISNATVLDGLRISGANAYQTHEDTDLIQPDTGVAQLVRDQFFFSDGGGIKIFGRSYPTLLNLIVEDNLARPCGGGVSVEHRGFRDQSVVFENCVFRNNSCQLTGAAVDVLPGSAARFQNCLFVGNTGNNGHDDVSQQGRQYNREHGSGALTVFPESRVSVVRCTFTANRNGVDDKGRGNEYRNCLFWRNSVPGGTPKGTRYEMDIIHAVNVRQCHIGGAEVDLRGSLDPNSNSLEIPDPCLDRDFVPQSPGLSETGYRPVVRQ